MNMFKRNLLWIIAFVISAVPNLALAAEVHVSGFINPFVTILVIIVLALAFLWAIKYWASEMIKIWDILPRVLSFIVSIIAIVWIIIILARLAGVNIT